MPITIAGCTYSGGVPAAAMAVNYNGVQITSPTATINFTGAGVTVSGTGSGSASTATVTIAGGSGSGASWGVAHGTGTSLGYSGIITSTNTQVVIFDSNTTTGITTGGATYFFALNPSSVTLLGNTGFALLASSQIFSGTEAFNSPQQSTFTFGVIAGSFTVKTGIGNNTGIVFQNGQTYSNSSTFLWNGSTVTAPVISGSTIAVTNMLKVTSLAGASPTSFTLSVSSSTQLILGVQDNGHTVSSGTLPTAGSCGTLATMNTNSTDEAGSISWTGAATTCAVNFGANYTSAPFCTANSSGAGFVELTTVANTGLNFTLSASVTGGSITWICRGGKGG